MARKLSHLSQPIARYMHKRFARKKMAVSILGDNIILPDVLKPAYLRGQALFTSEVFLALEKRHFTAPHTQIQFWEQLTEKNNYIQTIIEHAELMNYIRIDGNASSETNKSIAKILYYSVLWDAYTQKDKTMISIMTDGFVTYFLPSTFPKHSEKKDVESYRKAITVELAKQWHTRPIVKESFNTEKNAVNFKLIAKLPQHTDTLLIHLQGARLKPTRLEAYQRVLGALRMGRLTFDTPNKY